MVANNFCFDLQCCYSRQKLIINISTVVVLEIKQTVNQARNQSDTRCLSLDDMHQIRSLIISRASGKDIERTRQH